MGFRSGYVSIVGRPNVGKSTLLNTLIGQKIAIVSPKAQTTRNTIMGIKNLPDSQIIFMDTPGIHRPLHKLGEMMVKSAIKSVENMDLIVYVVLPVLPDRREKDSIKKVIGKGTRCILAVNKIDTVKKDALLPVIAKYAGMFSFDGIVPLSAITGSGVDVLIMEIKKYLPEGPGLYPDDMATDQVERFLLSEIIREKAILNTRDEIPHSVAVEVIRWDESSADNMIRADANIYVERESQKGIIIGKRGRMLKKIGSEARMEIEDALGIKFFLSLWVKVKKDWRENPSFLEEMGIK
ncbi:GTPase Era [bacterium BMS3Bbin05]|nr:GTPase Era [bacterium BMS3Bbin05]